MVFTQMIARIDSTCVYNLYAYVSNWFMLGYSL